MLTVQHLRNDSNDDAKHVQRIFEDGPRRENHFNEVIKSDGYSINSSRGTGLHWISHVADLDGFLLF